MKRKETLERAIECVCGKREQDYGTPEDNFNIIARYWNVWLRDILRPGCEVDAVDVAMMMGLLKVGRISTGTATDDSFVDLAGYTACAAEILEKNRNKESSKPTISIEVTGEEDEQPSVSDLYDIYKNETVKLHTD